MDKRNISVYKALTNQDIDTDPLILHTPSHYIPTPSESDYKTGFISRYFVKKINNDFVYETSQKDYSNVDLSTWQKVEVEWKITGPRFTQNSVQGVEPFNNTQIDLSSAKIHEIRQVLSNPIQFARIY